MSKMRTKYGPSLSLGEQLRWLRQPQALHPVCIVPDPLYDIVTYTSCANPDQGDYWYF